MKQTWLYVLAIIVLSLAAEVWVVHNLNLNEYPNLEIIMVIAAGIALALVMPRKKWYFTPGITGFMAILLFLTIGFVKFSLMEQRGVLTKAQVMEKGPLFKKSAFVELQYTFEGKTYRDNETIYPREIELVGDTLPIKLVSGKPWIYKIEWPDIK